MFIREGLDFQVEHVPVFLNSVGKWLTVEEGLLEMYHVRFHAGYVHFAKYKYLPWYLLI